MGEKDIKKGKPEISAGGVVFKKEKGKIQFAVASRYDSKDKLVYCLPKGHIEEGESVRNAALREVREETGLVAEIVEKLGQISYFYKNPKLDRPVFKIVYFFLMKYVSGDVRDHDFELKDVQWLDCKDALEKLSYKSEKEICKKAITLLEKNRIT